MIPTVTLDEDDLAKATAEAHAQIDRKIKHGRNSDHGGVSTRPIEKRLTHTINGLLGEIAVSKYLDLPWTPGGFTVSRGDVDRRIEVRQTVHERGRLVINTNDNDGSWFVLTVGEYPTFKIVGAILCRKAKQLGTWRDDFDPPCWLVEQDQLLPTSDWKKAKSVTDKFVYLCGICGGIAHYGVGVHLRTNVIGTWYCAEHRPQK